MQQRGFGGTNRNASQLRKMSKSLWKYLLSRSCLVTGGSSSTSLARRARAIELPPVVRVLNMLGVRLGLRCGAAAGRDTASRSSSSSVRASSASASVIESS